MEEFVAYIIKNLVSQPQSVDVKCTDEQDRLSIEIRVADEDVGKIIGRRGNTINALRTIVRTVATRLGRKVQIDLIQTDQDGQETSDSVDSEECMSCCDEEQDCASFEQEELVEVSAE